MPILDDAEYSGREALQNELLAAFERGQAVQIIGPRRMGKSSLLRWMERKAMEMGKPVAFVNARGLAGRSPVDLVWAAAQALAKRTVGPVLHAVHAVPDASDAARAAAVLAPVTLLVDEADALAEKDHGFDKGFFETLRALGQDRRIQWVSASQGDLFELFVGAGLTSAFLNDARKIHVGAMSRHDAEALLLRDGVKDAFRRGFAWEVAGGLAPALRWIGPKLGADADPAVVEKELGGWMGSLFKQWWEGLGEEERALLKGAVRDGLKVAELADAERRRAERLALSGFLVEADGGRMVLGGRVWREFVRHVG